MVKTQEEIEKEAGGVVTSITARGSPMMDEELSKEEMEELLAGEKKHALNGDL